jgi:hypothetical protein
MAVIHETNWMDGKDLNAAQAELLARVLEDALHSSQRCVVCRAKQPKHVGWATYAMELESKSSGYNSGDIAYRACPGCEPALDKFLFALETKH